jgi:hypothetical protein
MLGGYPVYAAVFDPTCNIKSGSCDADSGSGRKMVGELLVRLFMFLGHYHTVKLT